MQELCNVSIIDTFQQIIKKSIRFNSLIVHELSITTKRVSSCKDIKTSKPHKKFAASRHVSKPLHAAV